MTHREIIVKNASGAPQNFLILNDTPVTNAEEFDTVYNTIWGRSPGVPSTGSVKFGIEGRDYAVCGDADFPLKTGDEVRATEYREVELASSNKGGSVEGLDVKDDVPFFTGPVSGQAASKIGSFEILTSAFESSNKSRSFTGLGLRSPTNSQGDIIPVSLWRAAPNVAYQIIPKIKYYITVGDYAPGTVVDPRVFSPVATVDFTGRDEKVALVTLTPRNEYEVQYQ